MSQQLRQRLADDPDLSRSLLHEIAMKGKEYCGLPFPLDGHKLIVEKRHPAYEVFADHNAKIALGGDLKIVNTFWSSHKRCEIVIYDDDGKRKWGYLPGIHHLDQDVSTMGCSGVWSVESELKAMKLLETLVPAHIFRMYFMTGMFLETSERSGVTYIFRRLKPTVAIRPHRNRMKILTCLCLHPIGYYADTWAGAMVPTDDVIAHLLMMRGDEPMFWRKANHIPAYKPNAGL